MRSHKALPHRIIKLSYVSFCFGGNDCNNMIIPYDGYTSYSTVRNPSGLAIPQSVLHQVTPVSSGGIKYGFHPNLSPEIANLTQAPGLLTLWATTEAGITMQCRHAGSADDAGCNIKQGRADPTSCSRIPIRRHNRWRRSQIIPARQVGVAESLMLRGGLNGPVALPMAISTAGTSIFATGRTTTALSVNAAPAALNTLFDLTITGGSAADQTGPENCLRPTAWHGSRPVPGESRK